LRKTLSFACLVVVLLVTFAAGARAQVATPKNLTFVGGKTSFTLPFELVDNRIFINVTLDGRGVETLRLIAARNALKDARRKRVRLTVQDDTGTREVVVKFRDLV
jgi:hypothetical protein